MKTEFNKETNKLRVFGNKESIEALTEHVQAKISNCKTTAYVKLSREHFLFLKKFVFGDTKWLAKVCATNQPTQKKEERKKQTNKTKIPVSYCLYLIIFQAQELEVELKFSEASWSFTLKGTQANMRIIKVAEQNKTKKRRGITSVYFDQN